MDDLPEVELQQELQRFTTEFADRITEATEIVERSGRRSIRNEAMRKNLRYISSAMEIATGPYCEVNLLDMIVFVRLCRAVVEKFWIPKVYGAEGANLANAFSRAEQELS